MESIGAILRQKREEAGISLTQVQEDLKISLKFLDALEREDFSSLPAPAYCRGFLRSYARYLKADVDEIIAAFDARHYPSEKTFSKDTEHADFLKDKPIMIWVLSGAAIVLVLILAGRMFKTKTAVEPQQSAVGMTLPAAEMPAEQQVNAEGLNLTAKASDTVWIQVISDGETSSEAILKSGESKSWQAKDKFTVWVGNVPAVQMFLNGKPVDLNAQQEKVIKDLVLNRKYLDSMVQR